MIKVKRMGNLLNMLRRKLVALRSLEKNEGGFLGLGSIVLVVVVIGLATAVFLAYGGLSAILDALAEEVKLGQLLIHIPQMSGVATTFGEPVGKGIFVASNVMGDLYQTLRTISILVVMIGTVFIGLSYGLEQFNIVREGTASTLLSESVLILILILVFPLLFNAMAVTLNGMNEGLIMHHTITADEAAVSNYDEGQVVGYEDMTKYVAKKAGNVPGIGWAAKAFPLVGNIPGIGDLASQPSKLVVVLITATISIMSVLIAFAVGVFRVLATAALAGAFPLILAIRLIPPLRSVSTRLTSSLIGILLATTVMALFTRVAWHILVAGSLSGIMSWAVAVGTLIALGAAFTITAPALSSMAGAFGGTIGRGAAASAGGLIGGAVMGGVAGTMGTGAAFMRTRGMGLGANQRAGIMGRAGLSSFARGATKREPFSAGLVGADKTPAESDAEIGKAVGFEGQRKSVMNDLGDRFNKDFGNYREQVKDRDLVAETDQKGGNMIENLRDDKLGDDEHHEISGWARVPNAPVEKSKRLSAATRGYKEIKKGVEDFIWRGHENEREMFENKQISKEAVSSEVKQRAAFIEDGRTGKWKNGELLKG